MPAFAGRAAELAALDGFIDSGGTPVVISAVCGTARVGKTALAVHWAHLVRDRFPDGQLYVDLRGYDTDRPMPPADALARFLTALGVPGRDIPSRLDGRIARYRTELAGRHMLILLDTASSADQVRPLLPGTAPNAVLVTSRNSLAGLVARDRARRIDLGPLWTGGSSACRPPVDLPTGASSPCREAPELHKTPVRRSISRGENG